VGARLLQHHREVPLCVRQVAKRHPDPSTFFEQQQLGMRAARHWQPYDKFQRTREILLGGGGRITIHRDFSRLYQIFNRSWEVPASFKVYGQSGCDPARLVTVMPHQLLAGLAV